MIITIGKPYAVSDKGRRRNNEDSVFPLPEKEDPDRKLFIVCDGVGGAEKGEVASALACESLSVYFDIFLEGDPTADFIQKAIRYTEARFDDYVSAHPEATGMATTLTLIYIGTNGITLAHIGDSRIYHFRKGQIQYQTADHSLVNSWVQLGRITEAEALVHPQRNVILRAIQGSIRPTEADVYLLQDVEAGDVLFMCTDGALEPFDNSSLSSVFKQSHSSESMKDAITEACQEKTRDNFSFYIIPIQNVQETFGLKQNFLSFLYSLA